MEEGHFAALGGRRARAAFKARQNAGTTGRQVEEETIGSNDDLLSGLNPEQLAAVTAPNEGSLLVLAGAGCGKTAVLTRRIAFLVRSGIDPARICALTFSRKAAEEMAHRLAKLDPACGGQNAPLVTTFHAFALRVLQENVNGSRNFDRIGFRSGAELLGFRQRLEILSQITTAQTRKVLRMNVTQLDNALNVLASFPEKAYQKWSEADVKLLMKADEDFLKVRKERGVWDFSDLMSGCIELFKNNPPIADIYANRYDAILVDEFQDTNPVQIDLLDMLLGTYKASASAATERAADHDDGGIGINTGINTTLYAVGDDDQAIYGFRGADIRPIQNFTTRFRNASIVKLQINYRSVPAVLNCANRLWVSKPAEYRKTLVTGLSPVPSGIRKPQTMRFGDQSAALEWILGKARFIRRRENIPVSSMAVLFRINDTLNAVAGHYKSMALPDDDTPQLLTIHASKGLEYPAVFLCDLEEGVFPHYKIRKERAIGTWTELLMSIVDPKKPKIDASCDIDEELRLFYVGVTRAQRFLYFVTVKKKPFYGRDMKFAPSRFLRLVR